MTWSERWLPRDGRHGIEEEEVQLLHTLDCATRHGFGGKNVSFGRGIEVGAGGMRLGNGSNASVP